MKTKQVILLATLAIAAGPLALSTVEAQGTAFTYQGQLNTNGAPANGRYDFQFSLYNSPQLPPAGSLIGNTVTNLAVGVTNGEFTTTLDFGAVFAGNATWLELSVRSNGAGSYTALTPLQELTPSPYAIFAATASNVAGTLPAAQLTGMISAAQLPATAVTNQEGGVTLGSLTVSGDLSLSATTTIYSGSNTFLHDDGSLDFFAGQGAGNLTSSGVGNTANGALALNQNVSGSENTAVGVEALQFMTNDNQLVAVGYQALQNDNGRNPGGWLTISGNGENTAVGYQSLMANTYGFANTAVGYQSLNQNTTGEASTAIGDGALYYNTSGLCNVAVGYQVLFSNTTASENTAIGLQTMYCNTTGSDNTATGWGTLYYNVTGSENSAYGYNALELSTNDNQLVAVGFQALLNDNATNEDGTLSGNGENTAIGYQALLSDTYGYANTALGYESLCQNINGNANTAVGDGALWWNEAGNNNVALGDQALFYATGSQNIALGAQAGINLTTGGGNIDIGNQGGANDSNVIRIGSEGTQTNTFIAGIYDNVSFTGMAVPVCVDENGRLGIAGSSEHFKQDVRSMDDASDALLSLRPVTYQYKPGLDPKGSRQFGLVAEEVDKVAPDLVVHDARHGTYTVRYDAVNAMLLNEFLKQHKKGEEQNAEIAALKEKSAKVDALEKQLNELKQMVQWLAARK